MYIEAFRAKGDAMISAKTSVPQEQWISSSLWRKVINVMPIPCVDIIFQREDRSILYGWRLINPYNNVWALPGGRILYRENITQCAHRIARHYGLRFRELHLVGIFPVNFPKRSDITIAVAALKVSGQPKVDRFEFSRFAWFKTDPRRLATNYRRMVTKWTQVSKSADFLKHSRIL